MEVNGMYSFWLNVGLIVAAALSVEVASGVIYYVRSKKWLDSCEIAAGHEVKRERIRIKYL